MRRAKDAAAGTPATAALRAAGIAFASHSYTHDASATSFGLEAAQALNLDPARVFKTLIAEADGTLAVAVVPVAGQLDLKALATVVNAKRAQLAAPSLAQRKTGYVVGGISPVGQKSRLITVVDDSAAAFDTVYVSGGRRGLDIELAPQDLLSVTGGRYARIGRAG